MVSLQQNQNLQASKKDLVITQKPTQDLPIFATLRKTMTVTLTQERKIFFFQTQNKINTIIYPKQVSLIS